MEWPADGAAVSHLLRAQADRLCAELAAIAEAFKEVLPPVAGRLEGEMAREVEALAGQLDGGCRAAVERVREGFRGLISVVWLATVHRDGLSEQATAAAAAAAAADADGSSQRRRLPAAEQAASQEAAPEAQAAQDATPCPSSHATEVADRTPVPDEVSPSAEVAAGRAAAPAGRGAAGRGRGRGRARTKKSE